jgi:hypothetical protein
MTQYLFRNVELLDPAQDRLLGGREVLVEGELVREVSGRPLPAGRAVIDGSGALMPGDRLPRARVPGKVNIRNLGSRSLMTARAAG